MRQRWLWLFMMLFAATSAAEGYYIYSHTAVQPAAPVPDAWAQQDQWIAQARKNLLQGAPIPLKDFDDLFDDQFFSRRFDPFAEMLDFQKRMDAELNGPQKSLFGQSWNDWFGDRMGLSAIQEKTRETDKEVVVELKIPGLDKDSLSVNVNAARIRVAYDAKRAADKKDAQGRAYFEAESVQHFEKIMPVPEDADPRKNRIDREGDVIKIVFPRRPSGVKADA